MTNVTQLPLYKYDHLATLVEEIKALILAHEGRISLAEAVGVLEVIKLELIQEHQ